MKLILISFNAVGLSDTPGSSHGSSHSSPTGILPNKAHKTSRNTPPITKRDSSSALPTHLISAANQQKAGAGGVKQQLPMKLAKLGSGSSSSSSSMSSSLSSSMGGSMGGSMSPSQEQRVGARELPREQSRASSIGVAGVTQMLPLKLIESAMCNDSKSGLPRSGAPGYQRLHSPPPTTSVEDAASAHHRTGSSPATLQNGSSPLQTVATGILGVGNIGGSVGAVTAGQKAARTNTYPKLSNKPVFSSSGSDVRQPPPVPNRTTVSPVSQVQQLPSNTRPGQRIKDPDTNEDIIFF